MGQPKAVDGADQLDSLGSFRGPPVLKAMSKTLPEKGMLAWETNSKCTTIVWKGESLPYIPHPPWKDETVQ